MFCIIYRDMKKKIIEILDVSKTYGDGDGITQALKDIRLDIYEGEFLVILGSSGSGKSTLLNIIGAVDNEDTGLVKSCGKTISIMNEVAKTKYRKNNIGFVFQSFNLINELTVLENIVLVSGNKAKAKEALKVVGIENKENSYPNKLSGGQKQRVAIARAIVNKPKILLCDEPTGALDYETGRMILALLEKINIENKTTIIFVTHTKEIAKMADRVVKLRSGKIESIVKNKKRLSSKDIEW